MRGLTIVSGGQTGAQRGALQAAIDMAIGHGGWAPAGWRADDGEVPAVYRARMRLTSSADYGMCTRLNIQGSDATLVVSLAAQLTGSAAFVDRAAERMGRTYLHLVLPAGGLSSIPNGLRGELVAWLEEERIGVLNVAGPLEVEAPGIQEAVRDALVWVLEDEIHG